MTRVTRTRTESHREPNIIKTAVVCKPCLNLLTEHKSANCYHCPVSVSSVVLLLQVIFHLVG